MKKINAVLIALFLLLSANAPAQQLPNNQFEDWSGEKFDGEIQPQSWHFSNVTQLGFNFNFAQRTTGHNGGYCMKVEDQKLEVAGIGEEAPGYISLGYPWVYVESLGKLDEATAGTIGGINWTYRPDTMVVWIKRTGDNTASEDFHLLFYSWTGTAFSNQYKGKKGGCTSYSRTDEESDIRLNADGNECGTVTSGKQVAEGWIFGRKTYNDWTQIKVPIYYLNNTVPEKANVIFSAGNYPNFRANSGLYAGNALYIDDVELIYSSKIQQLIIGGEEWKSFNPNSTAVQTYVLKDNVDKIPAIKAIRGAGQLTNTRGVNTLYRGRQLEGNEITIVPGEIDEEPTTITVRAEDGTSETTYQILFAHKASNNASLSGIKVNGTAITFDPNCCDYTVEVPYGSSSAPVVSVVKQEDRQTVQFTQPTSINDVTVIVVTAADGVTTKTYTLRYKEAPLSDNTLQDIKVNGISVPGYMPTKTSYHVSIPLGTTQMPTVEAISKYPKGMQTIVMTPPSVIDGGVYRIAVTTPGNASPKEYKLTFALELSSYCKLQNIFLDGVALVGFSPDITAYSISLPIGTQALPKITYIVGDPYQTISIAEGGLDGTTRITVTAANGDQQVYKLTFSTEKSTISTLDGITLDGKMIDGFDKAVTSYKVQLPIGTSTLPDIQVIKADPYQTVSIRAGGLNGVTYITVSAGNGSTTIYQIAFSVEQATNATLKGIAIGGVELSGFDPNQLEYTYILPQGTTELPVITYTPHDPYQTITTRSGGVNGDYKITVRPQSGASQTYVIHFIVPKSDNASLKMIYLNGNELLNFDANRFAYTDTLDSYALPQVTYEGYEGQKIIGYLNDNVYTIKVTSESGKSNSYTIQFVVRVSESAFLNMIYLDGDSLLGFVREQLSYKNIIIAPQTSPVITVDCSEGQQVTILRPSGEGTAQIIVTANGGNSNTYLLEFIDTTVIPVPHLDPKEEYIPSNDARLLTILANGVALPDFDTAKLTYTILVEASEKEPEITFVPRSDKQTVVAGTIGNHISQAQVTAEDGTSYTYSVTTQRALYSDALLRDIQIEGKQISFSPTTFTYSLMLDEGQALPQLTYQTAPGQTVMMYSPNSTTQQLIVTAEDGSQNTYIVTYTRVMSHNALLRDIIIEGHSIEGFTPTTYAYTDSLEYGTQVVPVVNAIGAVDGQTITTYFSRVKGVTRIHVVAEDGVSTADYTIAFPTHPSSNTALNNMSIEASYTIEELNFDPDQTDYTVYIPFEATLAPTIVFEKGEKEQTVTYIARSIGQTSQVIVRAENGDERTYSIQIQRSATTQANVLKSITVTESGQSVDLSNPNQREWDIELPYGANNMTVSYVKNYNAQTVLVEPGGILHPTRILVLSNNGQQPTTIYTLNPKPTTQCPAVVTGITIDGVALTGFDKNRFNYIVNRDNANSWPEIEVSKASNVSIHQTSSPWESKIIVTAGDYTNTYHLFFHYPNDIIPNGEFDQWTTTSSSGTNKPTDWNVPGDYLNTYASTAKAGNTVSKDGSSAVHLKTTYWAALMGAVPAVMNLGDMAASFAVAGGTRVVPYGSIAYHNSPDYAIINYKYPDKQGNGALFRFKFTDTNSETYTYDFNATNSTSNYSDYLINLGTAGKNILNMDIIIDATGQYPDASSNANLYVDYIRFAYNNTLDGLLVNNIAATRNDKAFSITLDDPEYITLPQLTFQQGVVDQAQQIDWQVPTIQGGYSIRNATITNYGEDGNYSTYTLEVKRPLDTNANLKSIQVEGKKITGFKQSQTEYTYLLPYGTAFLPDVVPVLNSTLQSCVTTIKDSTVTMVVTPEQGAPRTYTVRFVIDSDHAMLNNIYASGMTEEFQKDRYDYTITANEWPTISIEKSYDAQFVTMTEGVIDVTASNGATQQYRLHLVAPIVTTSGQLKELELDGNPVASFRPDIYVYELPRPQLMSFTRQDAVDSVIYVQTPDSLLWQVYGTTYHQYKLVPLITQSTTTELKGIYVNGELIEGFNPRIADYTIYTDTAVQLTAIGMSSHQTIDITREESTYTISVTAQSGATGTPYTVKVLPTCSSDASLKAIYIDGQLIKGYDPKITQYAIELPVGAYKQAEPVVPHINYEPTDSKALVEVELAELGDTTRLYVTSSDGTQRSTYSLIITAEPSHNAQLKALAVNDIAIELFEPGRHYYSVQVAPGDIRFDWRSWDRFQTVTIDTLSLIEYQLHVVAQDKVTTEDYTIEVFTQSLSSDATLANILIDEKDMSLFYPDMNPDLMFNSGLNKYTIYVPTSLTHTPHVSATLKHNGQLLSMRQEQSCIYLDVTAEDGSINTYTLKFVGHLSTNTDLKAIYLDGEAYSAFQTDKHLYCIDLPKSQHTLPDIIPIKAESAQQWDTASVYTSLGHQMTIRVTAEDQAYQSDYILIFQMHPSDVDTLGMLMADSLHYQAQVFNYHCYIPYNKAHIFPALEWEVGDKYQTVHIDTLEQTDYSLTRQLVVTAENGNRNRYTITYTMVRSNITTLQMIYINGHDSLPNYDPATTDYIYTLPTGTTIVPQLEAAYDATTQSVEKIVIPSSLPGVLATNQFIVTAQDEEQRTYSVTLVVAPDTTATLTMISYNGQNVPRYDEMIYSYSVSLSKGDSPLPLITYTKHNDQQNVDIVVVDSNQVDLVVTAADGIHQQTYSLLFLPYLSDNGQLKAIYLNDTLLSGFNPIQDSYEVKIPTVNDLPVITYELAEPMQKVIMTTDYRYTEGGLIYDVIQTLKVVPENEVDTAYYEIVFHIKENTPLRPEESENALLQAIYVDGQMLNQSMGFDKDFTSEVKDYVLHYSIGTNPDLFYDKEDIVALPQDSLAQIVSMDVEVKRTALDTADIEVAVATCIHITVKAPAGNLLTYNIYQDLILDSLNQTTDLIIADYVGDMRSLEEFEPGNFYYEYTLSDTRTTAPAFTLQRNNPNSRFACVRLGLGNNSRVVDADDDTNYAFDDSEEDPTYHIYYRAENGDKYMYKIKFRRSEIKRAQKPMEGDVLIQPIPGSCQIAVASLRANVVFALYDMTGRLIEVVKLEEGNPNSFATITDGYGQTYFGHLTDFSSCTIITLEPSKIYFWCFTENGKRKIRSGKMAILP